MPSKKNRSQSTTSTAKSQPMAGASAKRAPVQMNKRQARAAQRAMERRRRAIVFSVLAAVIVVAALGFVVKDHLPTKNNVAKSKPTAVVSCTPTMTTIGPAPTTQPPATPPPVSGKTVQGEQGLQYIDITPGCGPAVKAGDNVTVNYTGWLASNGTMFDSSLKPGGQPLPVQNVGQAQVISGWNLGLIGMKAGGERRLIIPAALAYGAQGYPPAIPPNATLIFDITVVSIG